MDHDQRRLHLLCEMDRAVDLPGGVGAPHPAGDQQERGVDGFDPKAELPSERSEEMWLLGMRVLGDHDLHRAEAGRRDVAERLPQGQPEERSSGEQQPRAGLQCLRRLQRFRMWHMGASL